MARYKNGQIPDSELVRLGTEHYATPATAQRIKNLVADVKAKEGFTLEVTGGPNIYRNLKWQNFYWEVLPYPQAAYPGTSSHGGEYQGRDAIAVDFNNWAILPRQKWFDYARKHGFTPNIFSWEPWHIVDFNPWSMPSSSGGQESEEDEMSEKAEKQIQSIYDAVFSGGNSMKDNKKSISQSLAEIQEKVGPIYRSSGPVSLRQEIANINNKVTQLQATQAGLEEALKAVANAKGLDPDAILKAAQNGVENALRNVTFTASVD